MQFPNHSKMYQHVPSMYVHNLIGFLHSKTENEKIALQRKKSILAGE